MYQLLQTYKPIIDTGIDQLAKTLADNRLTWSHIVVSKLAETTKRGKGVRGALFLSATDVFTGTHTENDVTLAVALEFLHSALLIHDDLLDHDDLRRGQPSLHKQFELEGTQSHVTQADEYGKAMALCAGDIAIFSGFSSLSKLTYDAAILTQILSIVTREFLVVGFGEMEDVALTYTTAVPPVEQVLSMYTYKTARYTFSLPLLLAGIVSKLNQDTTQTLEQLGEKFGLLFQLTDDMLTLTGDQETVGKTIGNDISENKKTLYNVMLQQRATPRDKESLSALFGNPTITSKEIKVILEMMKTYNVEADIQKQIQQFEAESRTLLAQVPTPSFFEEILTFLLTRNK